MRLFLKTVLISLFFATILSWIGLAHERLDILSHFRLHFSILAISLALLFCINLSWRWATIATLLASFNFLTSIGLPQTSMAFANQNPQSKLVLKIMSINTLYLAKNDAQIIEIIERIEPDIILMQEVPPWKTGILEHLRKQYPWQEHCATPTQCEVALLSRHPWQYSESGIYGQDGGAMAFARFGRELNSLTIASIHLRWPFKSPQLSNLSDAFQQLEPLKNIDGSLIIGGDFNSTTWSTVLRDFSKSTNLKSAGSFQATWPVRSPQTGLSHTWLFPQFQLDHIFVSDDIEVIDFRRGNDTGSDHLPLISEISLSQP